jgi:predicted bacteriocin transport accessory protein
MKKSKKKRKDYKVLIGGIVVIVLLLSSVLLQAISINNKNNNSYTSGGNEEPSGNWQEALASSDLNLIYLGRPTCGWCNKIRPHLNYMTEKYDLSFIYVNMDEISSGDQTTLFSKLDIDVNEFGTPYLAVIKDGKKIAEQVGFVPEEELFKFVQDNKLIDKDAKYENSGISDEEEEEPVVEDNSAYTDIDFVDFNKYKEIYESGNESVLVLGQTGCSYCNKYKPVINEIAKEKNITINYLDVRNINQEEWNTLISNLNDYFKDHEQWGTPLTLIIKDKKVIDYQEGYNEKSTALKFLKDNGLIK